MDENLLLFDPPSESPAQIIVAQINNPFDECEWIANHNPANSEDPFDIVAENINKFDRRETNNLLINMNCSCESSSRNYNVSNSPLNRSADRSGNSSIRTPGSVKMAHKLIKSSSASPSPVSLKRDCFSLDSGILRAAQGRSLLEKLRAPTSFDGNTLVSVTKKTHELMSVSVVESSEDLNSTIPKWVELDDVSDIETLTIPFLKDNETNEVFSSPPALQCHEAGGNGEQHTKSEINTILANIKKSNEFEEKKIFLNNFQSSVEDFIKRFEITKNCDKIKIVLKTLMDLLEEKEFLEENSNKSTKIARQETFDLPQKVSESVKSTSLVVPVSKRSTLNVSGRESISHRATVSTPKTTPRSKVRTSISHPVSASKKENRSPSVNMARRSLYATPSKLIKPTAESSSRLRVRTKTQTLSAGGPLKALESHARASTTGPQKIIVTTGSDRQIPVTSNAVVSNSVTAIHSLYRRTSCIPASTPNGKKISQIATPSRLSKLHTPTPIRSTLRDLNSS